ncbi:MAG TPA: universal stress protein [Cyanobacteria bacterium UBA12227]|nr:universal stress protein [Cyanobacteria bacterium UBA12227]HAX87770.1 universal stress protein [Cyanobacteria bacterium UBA11370]HBY75870.1 universal stress protein [Cyanobacteria bacterium UBA11148]
MIEKVLLAVAGRGLCEEMFNMLTEIPILQRASVTVLHVVTPQISADAMSAKLEEGGKILAEAVKSLNIDPSRITPRLKQGDPKDIVLQVAEEEKADLIIMGSRGLKRIESILENSVSQYVFQLSSRPMLLVKDDIYVKRINRIMIPLDKSAGAQRSLNLALSFLRDIKGGQLYLVHVNPDKQTASGEPITTPEQDPILASAAAEAKKQGVAYRCLNSTGQAGREICRLAEENNIDLLILGSPDRRPSIAKTLPDLDRLLGASLSDYVRVYANCPVLLARTLD